ncbi:palmitoyltransferase pfa5 [Xylographa carneopallida]|nr:palmitoyltransferase pfa5 [Xylographa carneopallida]
MVINQKAANVWTARVIPLILIGIVCYASFVIIGPLCIDYLLHPSVTYQAARLGAAIAILVIYFVLLFGVATTYFRILYAVISSPGYVERGPLFYANRKAQSAQAQPRSSKRRSASDGSDEKASRDLEKGIGGLGYTNGGSQLRGIVGGRPPPESNSPELQDFWKKEVVGGIISETNFKFFVQFNSWTVVYCIFILICLAIFTKEASNRNQNLNAHWVVTMALAGLFTLFSLGMSLSSLQFVLLNTTSVENLSRQTKIWTLAVHISRPPTTPNHVPFQTITYPLTPLPAGTPSTPSRSFAILHSKPGENPYDLGYYGNFKSVMGTNFFDWVVPLRYSPCCDHDSGESAFALGSVVQRMREEAGLSLTRDEDVNHKHNRQRRRRTRRHSTSHRRPKDPAFTEQVVEERPDSSNQEVGRDSNVVR